MDILTCNKCGLISTKDFFFRNGLCKKCHSEYNKTWAKANPEKRNFYAKDWRSKNHERSLEINKKSNDIRRRNAGQLPYRQNPKCPNYLGNHVAERVLRNVFENVTQLPLQNIGFDFICGKGKKIDVKSACLYYGINKNPLWAFNINKNEIADYFLLLAFDNRDNLTPMHMWLIPGVDINYRSTLGITITKISKLERYCLDISKVVDCCNTLKGDAVEIVS